MKIGFIGLGNVGGKLSESLLRNKFDLTVRDLDSNLTNNFAKQGASVAKTAKELVVAVARIDTWKRNRNFIIEELNWAINSKHCTLIPVIVGMDMEEVFERCKPYVPNEPKLSDYQAFCFHEPLPEDFYRDISDDIFRLERKRYKRKGQSSEAQSELPAEESPEDIYHKFLLPWPTDEALAYKAALEGKIVKSDMEHVHLALFYLKGRFGIKINNISHVDGTNNIIF